MSSDEIHSATVEVSLDGSATKVQKATLEEELASAGYPLPRVHCSKDQKWLHKEMRLLEKERFCRLWGCKRCCRFVHIILSYKVTYTTLWKDQRKKTHANYILV
ncbi:hypothetical protein ACQJBY_003202 [Aegilops geniculata]